MTPQQRQLAERLGHEFSEPELFLTALSHRSAPKRSNERMEFLGDSILNFTVAAALYDKSPHSSEGDLSRYRASLVCGERLAEIAQELDIKPCLILGSGEMKSGGARRASIQADAVEAIIGAIFLDAGIEKARQCILQWFASRLDELHKLPSPKDSKSQLQEYLQGRKQPLPTYHIENVQGEAHDQTFHVLCSVEGYDLKTLGIASSRRRAEQEAAEQFLQELMKGSK